MGRCEFDSVILKLLLLSKQVMRGVSENERGYNALY